MGVLRGLVPYAVLSAAIVVSAAVGIAGSLGGGGLEQIAPPAQATLAPSPTPIAGLSPTARIAYWRPGQQSIAASELWASDLDGSRRWVIGTLPAQAEVGLTRWSPDGGAVAYSLNGRGLAISWLDRSSAFIDLPTELRTASMRIVSFEWSPDSTRIAATFRNGNGIGNESDVYLVTARSGATWQRLTSIGDAFAGDWIDAGSLFVETASGAIGVLDLPTRRVTLITGMQATSPQIGRDGRVHFVAGAGVSADVTSRPLGGGSIWSMTLDGGDLRSDIVARRTQTRLVGFLADGRAIAGVTGAFYVAGETAVPLFAPSDTLVRVVLSSDGKKAIGVGLTRLLQLDVARIPKQIDAAAMASAWTVLLGDVRGADAWFPKAEVVPVRGGATSLGARPAALAYVAARSLWLALPGSAPLLAVPAAPGGTVDMPTWSPDGRRLATLSFSGPPDNRWSPVIVERATAAQIRPSLPVAPGTFVIQEQDGISWSPASDRIAVMTVSGDRADRFTAWLIDAASGRVVSSVPGRVSWSGDRMVVLTDGDPDPAQNIRVGQRVELRDASRTRTITDATRLAADPLLADLSDRDLPPVISHVAALGDGEHLAVWISRAINGGFRSSAIVVIRIDDGRALWRLPFQPLLNWPGDVTWSPVGHLVGWSIRETGRATVVDATTGATVASARGRFAGWSPDAASIYLARDDGLYARGIADGVESRLSPVGVPVVAARP